MKKLTIEFVKSEFEKEGYTVLDSEYIDAFNKFTYICSNGHIGKTFWNNWQQGRRCSTCAGKEKPTMDFIRSEFEKEGAILVSKKYTTSKVKLDYICSEGHICTITWSDWRNGYRCLICSGKKKHTFGFVKSKFEQYGYVLVSTVYVNAKSKLDYICPNGHKGAITFSNWQHGYRCKTCDNISRVGAGNSNWKGGLSCEPYCDIWINTEYKETIKERDGYKCLNPYCTAKNPNYLTIHHINYNKKSCGPENLITICRSCNARANKDRDWHESWYKAVLYRRYAIKNNL